MPACRGPLLEPGLVWGWGILSFLEQSRQTLGSCRNGKWKLVLTLVSARREQTEAMHNHIMTEPRAAGQS